MSGNYVNILPAPKNKEYNVFNGNFDTQDIIDSILIADRKSYKETRLLSSKFSKNNLYELWAFVRKHIRYKEDKANQFVKHPAKMWQDRKGDCKSMSLFIGTVLKNMGIPYRYRFVSYKPGDVTHVYVIATVNGKNIILDAVHHTYNEEVPYYKGIDYIPGENGVKTAKVAGINTGGIMKYIIIAGFVYIGYKIYKSA